ncbi:MAG: cytochrome c3 family protein [Nitrospirota bacterium]
MKQKILIFMLVSFSVLALISCGTLGEKKADNTLKGVVQDASGQAIGNAEVYLIPSSDVEAMAKIPIEIKRASKNDEPLEDNLAANKGRYQKGITDSMGNFSILNIPDGKYFIYAVPADKEHLPGGDTASKAMSTDEFRGKTVKILLSGNVPPNATYIGSSKCLICHTKYENIKKTAHKLGIRVGGKDSELQDTSRFPEFDNGLKKLTAGTKFYFYGFDKTRGFDKYMISEKMPSDPASVSFTATFFKDSDGKLKFRTENVMNPSDTPRVYTVEMTYGGALYKQRYLYRVGKSLFPFVQYNTHGNDSYNDRSRKQWRDYHADWLFNEETKKLTDPPKAKAFDKECASCHYTGYTLKKTADGEYIAGAVNDENGEFDIDGDGIPNEINIGCEVCHGPGSVHMKSPLNKKAATIVSPRKLASERSSVICGQCHSRPQGNLKNDQPVNKDNKMMIPGTSRNDYLVNYTTREDAAPKDFWPDGIHSKSHHQQYTDFLKSKKYRNGTKLLSCADCHDPHGKNAIKHQAKAEVKDGNLCISCHAGTSDIKAHTSAKVGMAHEKISCIDCHTTKTMQTGAGFGKGLIGKDGKNYWMNDVTSHIFDVPRKTNVGVKGIEPGKAMPIPYTNTCGSCHQADGL